MPAALLPSLTFALLVAVGVVLTRAVVRSPRRRAAWRARRATMIRSAVGLIAASLVGGWLVRGVVDASLPTIGVLVAQTAVLLLIDDAWFYGLHRAMHQIPALWRVHRVHHRAADPLPLDILYAHPVEIALGGSGLVVGAAAIVGATGTVSMAAFLLAVGVRQLHELHHHGGPASVLSHLPLLSPASHHHLHHTHPQAGNYASTFRLWDRVFGTCTEPSAVRPRVRARSTTLS